MNTYKFHAVLHDDSCSVTVRQNGEPIERYWFDTPEWALFFMQTCRALDNARYAKHVVGVADGNCLLFGGGGAWCDSTVYTKDQVDALLQRITSLEHWLEPLRTKARRFWDALMWGERGRV